METSLLAYDIVLVKWIDAAYNNETNFSEILRKGTRDFMIERTTLGFLVKKDDDGILILRDIDENGECEFDAIPNHWIKGEIEVVRKGTKSVFTP